MTSHKLIVQNTLGVHARPAGHIVNVASSTQCSVELLYSGQKVNAKSILNLMMLAIEPGAEVEFLINGPDEKKVADELTELFNNKFYEDAT
ncbi:MAG: HPr family phosphocarrier protein [Fibromonadaceae bacterium]|jgi:phosphocarrier protein|nr:HPr family phosphocarrier protein [Fibromonadaceae bacterium]